MHWKAHRAAVVAVMAVCSLSVFGGFDRALAGDLDSMSLELAGDWAIQSGDGPGWAAPGLDDSTWDRVSLPATWAELGLEGVEGTVWFRRSVDLREVRERLPGAGELGLRLGPTRYGSRRVFVNGEPLSPDQPPAGSIPLPAPAVYALGKALLDAEPWVVVVAVDRVAWASDRDPALGPFSGGIAVGYLDLLRQEVEVERYRELWKTWYVPVLAVLFVFTAAFYLSLYWRRHSRQISLWFALCCLGYAVNTLFASPWAPSVTRELGLIQRLVEASVHALAAVGVQFLWTFYRQPIRRWLRGLQLVHVSLAAIALFLPLQIVVESRGLRWWLFLPLLIAALQLVAKKAWRGGSEGRLVGSAVLVIVGIELALYVAPLFHWQLSSALADLSFALLVGAMAVTLSGRFDRAFGDLEQQVRQRTTELEEAHGSLREVEVVLSLTQRLTSLSVSDPGADPIAAALDEILDAFPDRRIVLVRYDDQGHMTLLGAATPPSWPSAGDVPGEAGSPLTSDALESLRRGQIVVVDEADNDERLAEARATSQLQGAEALLEVPVTRADDGLLCLRWEHPGPHWWNDSEIDVLTSAAACLALTWQQLRLGEAQQEAEENYRLLTQLSEGLVCRHTLDGTILSANLPAAQRLGYTPEGLVGMNLADILDPEVRDRLPEYLHRMGEKGHGTGVMRVRATDGDRRFWAYTGTRIQPPEGPATVLAFAHDVTERIEGELQLKESHTVLEKQMALERRQSQAKSEAILSAVPDLVLRMDRSGRLLDVRQPEESQLFSPAEEFIGRTVLETMPAAFAKECLDHIRRTLRERSVQPWEFTLKTSDATEHRFEARLSAADDEEVVAIVRNVTGEKRMQEELRQAQRMDTMGRLAGGIAHDFNNILTSVLGYTDLALLESKDGPVYDYLQHVATAGKRAKDLVEQILTFSRRVETEQRPMLLQHVVDETLKLLRPSLPATVDIETDLDVPCGPILADPTQMHQLVMNLATNSYQAMGDRGGLLVIRLDRQLGNRATCAGQPALWGKPCARLQVVDNGPGMSAAVQKRIFEPFFTTKAAGRGEGTGLGLSVVHGIVLGHGGAIRVDSTLGQGTRFDVYLPLAESELIEKESELRTAPGGQERLLVVDDEHEIVLMLRLTLERLGYDVTTFTDGAAALAAFSEARNDYDLIVTDLTMPGLTGEELAEQVVALRPDIPVIVQTGFSDRIPTGNGSPGCIRAFLQKPVSTTELAQTIRRALD